MLITKTMKQSEDGRPEVTVHAEIPLETVNHALSMCYGTTYICHAVMNLIKNVPMDEPMGYNEFALAYHDETDHNKTNVRVLSEQVVEQLITYLVKIYGESKSHLVYRPVHSSVQFKDWVDRVELIDSILEYIPDATLVIDITTCSPNGSN